MKNFIYRILSYSLDMLIVALIAFLIGMLNPNKNEIFSLYKKEDHAYSLYMDLKDNYKNIIKDDNISNEESAFIISNYSYYGQNFLNGPLSKTIDEDLKDTFNNKISELNYDINKKSIFNYLVFIIISIIYFGIIPFFNDGQTLFKKMFKIKIVFENKKSIFSMIIRSLLVSGSLLLLSNIICVNILNANNYRVFYNILNIVKIIYPLIFITLLIFKDDSKSLHDYLLKTKVLIYNKNNKLLESKMFK